MLDATASALLVFGDAERWTGFHLRHWRM